MTTSTTVRFAFFLMLLSLLIAGASPSSERTPGSPMKVVTLELDENRVTYVPTHPNVTVFIQFPHPISDYAGRGFSEDPSEVAGDFFIRHLDGDAYMAITPLTAVASRTLHVVCNGKGFPLHFFPAQEDAAWDKIIFIPSEKSSGEFPREKANQADGAGALKKERTFNVTRSAKPPQSVLKSMSTDRALGIIDTLRLLANLPEKKALAVVASNAALKFAVKNRRQDFGDFSITTHFVLRDNVFDALGFAVTVENTSREDLQFEPNSLTARAGDHVYTSLAADMNPLLHPKEKTPVFFVLAGDGASGANRLSCENDFRVSVDLVQRKNANPTTTMPIPEPSVASAGEHEE